MSKITLAPNAAGTATFTVAAPNTSTDRTLTLPDTSETLVAQGTALTLGTAVASTSGTAIDFTGIPAWVKRITVMFSGVSLSGTAHINVQLGTTSGFTVSGYLSTQQQGSASNASSTTGFISGGNGSTSVMSGSMVILKMGVSDIWIETNIVKLNTGNIAWGGGDVSISGTVDRVRITTEGTDTFDAGTVNIMYEG